MKAKEAKLDENQKELEIAEKEFVGGIGYRFHDENKRHLHTFNDKPLLGTSTITGVLAKPLTWWASGLAVAKLGWINSKTKVDGKYKTTPKEQRISHVQPYLEEIKGFTPEQFINRLDEAYKAHSEKLDSSADEGTRMHEELERYVNDKMKGKTIELNDYQKKVHPFIIWAEQNVKRFIASEGHTYSTRLWVGGITDCVAELNDGKIGIIDFKSSKESYDSQFLQAGGYDIQISENGIYDKNGVLIWKPTKAFDFYGVVPFGAEKFSVDMRYGTDELKKGFEAMVTLYKITNK